MNTSWPTVQLGEVIRHRKEFVTIDDVATYRRPRVQLRAQGIVLRDEVPGAVIKTKKQQVCRAGELLVAEIDAKVGGYGIVPASLDGSIVSSHYFLFSIDETRLDRTFLSYFTRTSSFRDQVDAQGSTNYAAIRASQVLGYELPLPSIEEQRRTVARIETLAERIQEAQRLRTQCNAETSKILEHTITEVINRLRTQHPLKPLGEVLTRSRARVALAPHELYRGVGTRMWGLGTYVHERKLGGAFDAERYSVAPRQLIYNEVWAHHGALGIVGDLGDHLVVSRHFHVFDVDWSLFEDGYLQCVFQSAWFWGACTDGSVGTTGRGHMRRGHFMGVSIPLPPIAEQTQIVSRLVALEAELKTLEQLQALSTSALDALLPAILDRAFKGEL